VKQNGGKMKKLILTAALVMVGAVTMAHAAETMGEKTEATANDAGRAMKKGAHRTEEALCMQGDAKCLAKKAKHRAEEGKDYTKDKAKEWKNDVDTK
jgi:hypothetical protein